LEIQGKLIEIFDTQQVSDRFRKREFVLEYATNPEYPEFLKFEMVQDRCEQLDGFAPEETVQVKFDLKGRKWTDRQGQVKYFNSLQAWQLTRLSAEGSSSPEPPSTPDGMPLPEPPPPGDDLPF
jgi:hypothetical protein